MSSPRLTVLSNLVRAMRIGVRADGPTVAVRIAALPRLTWDVVRGAYPGLSRAQLAAMVGALGYLLFPFDAAPEALLGVLGLVDDTVVAAWLVAAVVNATEDYLGWDVQAGREGRPSTVRSNVVG